MSELTKSSPQHLLLFLSARVVLLIVAANIGHTRASAAHESLKTTDVARLHH